MRIFFSLAPHFRKDPTYESSVRELAKRFDLRVVFAHEASAQVDPAEWIDAQIADCQFAFFDITGFDPEVLFALGVVSQSDDVSPHALIDTEEHAKVGVRGGEFAASLVAKAKKFHGADDFQRKAHMFIDQKVGAPQLLDKAFVATVKDRIKKKGPIYMRQLAREVGRPMPDVQPVVYDLVRKGDVTKVSDKRWAQYKA